MRCVTRVLFAASTIPEPVASARGSACGGDACGRRPVPCRCWRRGVAKVAQRPDHPVDAAGVVTQDLAVLLEPVGQCCMVGRHAQMLAGMPKVDHLGFGLETPEEGPVVGGGDDGADLGTPPPDMRDLACELRLQRALSALGHAAKTDGLQALTVVEGDRATGRLSRQQASERPSSPARSATMTPSSEAVTASCGMSSASRMSGPRLSRRSCAWSGAARCSQTASWRRACRRTPPLPPIIISPSRRPCQLVVDEAFVHRHQRPAARAGAVARTPKGHRARSSSSSAPHGTISARPARSGAHRRPGPRHPGSRSAYTLSRTRRSVSSKASAERCEPSC